MEFSPTYVELFGFEQRVEQDLNQQPLESGNGPLPTELLQLYVGGFSIIYKSISLYKLGVSGLPTLKVP